MTEYQSAALIPLGVDYESKRVFVEKHLRRLLEKEGCRDITVGAPFWNEDSSAQLVVARGEKDE